MHDTRTDPLTPVRDTVNRLSRGAPVISNPSDTDATWYPGSWLADPHGATLPGLIKYVTDAWGGDRHVAAALAFKGYGYAAALPVVAGWLGHGVVPLMESGTLRVGISDRLPYVRFDISDVRVVTSEAGHDRPADEAPPPGDVTALAAVARSSLLDGHLAEVVDTMSASTRVGRRLLWGSLAESVAHIAMRLDGVDGARRALAMLGEPVAGLVEITDGPDAPSINRRTCCLWFATDTGTGQYCSSCPVTA